MFTAKTNKCTCSARVPKRKGRWRRMTTLKTMSTLFLIAIIASIVGLPFWAMSQNSARGPARDFNDVIQRNASQFIDQGRQIFRFDTFGDEAFWGDALKLHQAIAGCIAPAQCCRRCDRLLRSRRCDPVDWNSMRAVPFNSRRFFRTWNWAAIGRMG